MTSLADLADYTYGEDLSKAKYSESELQLLRRGEHKRRFGNQLNARSRSYTRRGKAQTRQADVEWSSLKGALAGGAIGTGVGAGLGVAAGRLMRTDSKAGAQLGAAAGGLLGYSGGAVRGTNMAYNRSMKSGDTVAYNRRTGRKAKRVGVYDGKYRY